MLLELHRCDFLCVKNISLLTTAISKWIFFSCGLLLKPTISAEQEEVFFLLLIDSTPYRKCRVFMFPL